MKKPNIDGKNLPSKYKRRRYYTNAEVKVHNTANDCWISIFYEVYDLTKLIQENYGHLVDPLIKAAGTDISSWFDPVTKDPKICIIPDTNIQGYYCPNGFFLHVPPAEPDADWDYHFETP